MMTAKTMEWKTHCLFCSLCCPVEIRQQPGAAGFACQPPGGLNGSGALCGRGIGLVDLLDHPHQIRGGFSQQGQSRTSLSRADAMQEFVRMTDEALQEGSLAILMDGNLSCEDLVAIHQWCESKNHAVSLGVYLPPTDFDLLDGFSGDSMPFSAEDLSSCDGILMIGNVFATHPVLARTLLDLKYSHPRNLFAVMDTYPGITSTFANSFLQVSPDGHQKALDGILALCQSTEASVSETFADSVGMDIIQAEKFFRVLRQSRRLGVFITAEATNNVDWRSVVSLAQRIASIQGGHLWPLLVYGNALGAYRISRNLHLLRLEQLLEQAGKKPFTAFVQVGCDVSVAYPDELLRPLLSNSTRQILFTSFQSRGCSQADLVIGFPTPVQYGGTLINGAGAEKQLTTIHAALLPGAKEWFLNLCGKTWAPKWQDYWRNSPAGLTQPERLSIPARNTAEAKATVQLQAVASPVHFEDGTFSHAERWTVHMEGQGQLTLSPALARQAGVRNGESLVAVLDGKEIPLVCREDARLKENQALASMHNIAVRRFLPWELTGGRLHCSAPMIQLKAQREKGDI